MCVEGGGKGDIQHIKIEKENIKIEYGKAFIFLKFS